MCQRFVIQSGIEIWSTESRRCGGGKCLYKIGDWRMEGLVVQYPPFQKYPLKSFPLFPGSNHPSILYPIYFGNLFSRPDKKDLFEYLNYSYYYYLFYILSHTHTHTHTHCYILGISVFSFSILGFSSCIYLSTKCHILYLANNWSKLIPVYIYWIC